MGADINNVKAGVLDDAEWINEHGKPQLVYVERRIKWMPKLDGRLQLKSAYKIVEGTISPEIQDRGKERLDQLNRV